MRASSLLESVPICSVCPVKAESWYSLVPITPASRIIFRVLSLATALYTTLSIKNAQTALRNSQTSLYAKISQRRHAVFFHEV